MAVYSGFPSIRLEGDEGRALALIPAAKTLLYKVQTFKERAGVGTFSMSRRIDDDSTIYVLSAEDQHMIRIAVSPDVPEMVNVEDSTADGVLTPDFYSGFVVRGFIENRTRTDSEGNEVQFSVCTGYLPTPTSRNTHEELVAGRQDAPRLAVTPWVAFDMLRNPSSRPEFSQYTKLRSSMYSGTMKKVVQVVMGLGRVGKRKLRGASPKVPDSKYIKDVEATGVQVRFDWRFIRTHGITRATDGRLWLVEISQARGVLARPLPCFPASTTDKFRTAAADRGDFAMVRALDELGCLPTGEAFPGTAAQLNELIARGDVLRLMEPSGLQEFYAHSAYSSALGWAFNERGNEAHNTAYRFGDDGWQRGVWYQINISIGTSGGSASLSKNTEGFIVAGFSGDSRYIPIKFHEPIIGGLLSHEGAPAKKAANTPVPLADTPVFVAFVNGDLKVVKHYSNPKKDTFNNVDDPRYPGECDQVGDWTITEVSGSRSFPDMMYSNDFDDRKVLQEHVKVTKIKSEAVGYTPGVISDVLTAPSTAYVWRSRIFKRTTVVDEQGGERLVSAVAVPEYSREAYYYATALQFDLGRSGSRTVNYTALTDPNVGWSWRCFPGSHAVPSQCDPFECSGGQHCSGGVGVPKERRIVCLVHEEGGPCSYLADSGQWLTMCQNVDTFLTQAPPLRPTVNEFWNLGGDAQASLFLVSSGYGGPLSIPVDADTVFEQWMKPSKPESLQHIAAEHSAIGNDMLVYDAGFGGKVLTYGYAPDTIGPSDGHPTFIGVNAP